MLRLSLQKLFKTGFIICLAFAFYAPTFRFALVCPSVQKLCDKVGTSLSYEHISIVFFSNKREYYNAVHNCCQIQLHATMSDKYKLCFRCLKCMYKVYMAWTVRCVINSCISWLQSLARPSIHSHYSQSKTVQTDSEPGKIYTWVKVFRLFPQFQGFCTFENSFFI